MPAQPAPPGGAAGVGARVLSDHLMASACCSGCSEKGMKEGKEKEGKEGKEVGKDIGPKEGKESKEKEGIEITAPPGKLNVESTGVYDLYARVGVTRFNRYGTDKFTPLV